jgi:hypothetical protein
MRKRLFCAALWAISSAGLAGAKEAEPSVESGSAKSLAAPAPDVAGIRAILVEEARTANLPFEIADAVVHVESRYDPSVIGSVGEIGLMQVRPETAAMLGFKGSAIELAKPEINIHYGVAYLAEAWRLANGDLCRALMKYRAGWGEEVMTPRSVDYCARARLHLASRFSDSELVAALGPQLPPANASHVARETAVSPTSAYSRFTRGTEAASRAFWKIQEARVRTIAARVEAKWRRASKRG